MPSRDSPALRCLTAVTRVPRTLSIVRSLPAASSCGTCELLLWGSCNLSQIGNVYVVHRAPNRK